jgi:hypothetical protein
VQGDCAEPSKVTVAGQVTAVVVAAGLMVKPLESLLEA